VCSLVPFDFENRAVVPDRVVELVQVVCGDVLRRVFRCWVGSHEFAARVRGPSFLGRGWLMLGHHMVARAVAHIDV